MCKQFEQIVLYGRLQKKRILWRLLHYTQLNGYQLYNFQKLLVLKKKQRQFWLSILLLHFWHRTFLQVYSCLRFKLLKSLIHSVLATWILPGMCNICILVLHNIHNVLVTGHCGHSPSPHIALGRSCIYWCTGVCNWLTCQSFRSCKYNSDPRNTDYI